MISTLLTRIRRRPPADPGRGHVGPVLRTALGLPRRRWAVAVAILALAGTAVAGLLTLRVDTRPTAFLPAGEASLQELEDVARGFGGDPIVVLAESAQPGTLLGSEQLPVLLGLEGQLSRLRDVAVVYGPATVLNEVAISSQNLLAELSGRRDGVRAGAEQEARAAGASPAAVTAAGDRAVSAFDERYAPLLVRGLPAGLPTLHNPGFVRHVVYDDAGRPRPQWRFVVPAPDAVAILLRPRENLDQQGMDQLISSVHDTVSASRLQAARVTVTGAPAVAASLADQVRREVPLLGALAVGLIALVYVALPWLRSRRLRLLPIAVTLAGTAFTLAIFAFLGRPLSLGAMAFLPILIGIGSDFPAYLMHRAGRRRVLVAALASAAGFASLAISPLPFVRDLGLALALGVVIGVGFALLLRHRFGSDEQEEEPAGPREAAAGPSTRVRAGLAVVALLVAAAGWAALPRLGLQASPGDLAAGLPAIADVEHAEQVLGSSGEVRVVLRGPDVLSPEALGWMRTAQEAVVLRDGGRLRPVVSLPDLLAFLGPSPTGPQIENAVRLLPDYLVGSVASADRRAAVISLGVELQDLSTQQRLLDDLRAALPPTPAGYTAQVTGLPVVAARGYELVSVDRFLANTAGIAAAGLVLLVGLRRRSDALRAVAAAVLATGWGLALLALLGVPLSPLTVALGSLTTATACEFTVLLATARGSRTGRRRTVAVAATAAAVGYATLVVSELVVIREFGLLLATTVLLSLLAAHLVLLVAPRRPDAPRAAAVLVDAPEVVPV